jgi:uncharacterized membrane protein
LSDPGIDDDFMKDLGQGFKPGTAALFPLIRKLTADKVLAGLSRFKGRKGGGPSVCTGRY